MNTKESMTLTDNRNGKPYEYPILNGSRGPSVVNLRSFFGDTGMFTFDPGWAKAPLCSFSGLFSSDVYTECCRDSPLLFLS